MANYRSNFFAYISLDWTRSSSLLKVDDLISHMVLKTTKCRPTAACCRGACVRGPWGQLALQFLACMRKGTLRPIQAFNTKNVFAAARTPLGS